MDENNALESCFSEDHIKLFYTSDGKDTRVKPGSNHITDENIKDKEKFVFKIEIDGKEPTRFERNNTESCKIRPQIRSKDEKGQLEENKVWWTSGRIGIVIGLVNLFFLGRCSLKNICNSNELIQ